MNIRRATPKDFNKLYEMGQNTAEFKVSATEPFMDKDDFKWRLNSKKSIFLIAEDDKKIAGFIHFHLKDKDKKIQNRYACLTYIVVDQQYRRKGIATKLYAKAMMELKKTDITNIYCWASAESDNSIIKFMEKQGFNKGHKYYWMDKKIR